MSSINAIGHPFESRGTGYVAPALAVAAGIFALTELVLPNIPKKTDQTTIHGPEGAPIAVAGLRHASADFMKKDLEAHFGAIQSVRYATQGVESQSLADAFEKNFKASRETHITIIAHSLGMLASLSALSLLAKQGFPVPHIDTFYGIGGPRDYEDVYNSERYRPLPRIAGRVGGALAKATGVLVTDIWPAEHKSKEAYASARNLLTHFNDIQSPRQWASHLNMIYAADTLDLEPLMACGSLDSDTTISLSYERYDQVVKPVAADKWVQTFEPTGAEVVTRLGSSRSHADLGKIPVEFWQTKQQAYSAA